MTLVILPNEKVIVPVGAPCAGTQYFGPTDWNDPGGLWDGTKYVLPGVAVSSITAIGTWANGYRPSTFSVTYTLLGGYSFDVHEFKLRDSLGNLIGTTGSQSNGIGTHVTTAAALTFVDGTSASDILTFEFESFGYYSTTSVDGLCFDPP